MRKKILTYFLIITLIPFSIGAVLFYKYSLDNIYKELEDNMERQVSQSSELINRKLLSIMQISNYIITQLYDIRSEYISIIKDAELGNNEQSVHSFNYFMESVLFPFDTLSYSRGRVTNQLVIYLSDYSGFKGKYFKDISEIEDDSFVEKILQASPSQFLWKIEDIDGKVETQQIKLYKNISNMHVGVNGFIEILVDYWAAREIIDDMEIHDGGIIIHKISNSEILYTRSSEQANISEMMTAGKGKYIAVSSKVLIDGSTIDIIVPRKIEKKEQERFLLLSIILYSILIILVTSIVNMVSRKITSGLNDFIDIIKEDEGILLNEKDVVIKDDDISIIKHRFVNIIKRLNNMYKDLIDARNMKNLLEIELLQARINPHLLYNSLSVIRWMAMDNNDYKTVEIVSAMVNYYRITLNKGENFIEISKELELIEQYMKIVNFTHSSSVSYRLDVDVDHNMMNHKILKHLLQPFVENSIMHGLNGREDGKVIIKGYFADRYLVFKVIDNGYGMEAETLRNLSNENYTSIYGGYGVKNSANRIKLYYGDNCGISIVSEVGKGTEVTVKIREAGNYSESG